MSADADAYVNYWHHSGEKIKTLLGIDKTKLGTPEDSRERFLAMIRAPDAAQASVVFTITLNDLVIGYTNLNCYGPSSNYVHLHTYYSSMRAAVRTRGTTPIDSGSGGCGVATVLIGRIIAMCFSLFTLQRLILQTRPINYPINRALDLYMPVDETRYVENPAGLAAAGELHLRYVYPSDVLWLLDRAAFLTSSLARTETKFQGARENRVTQRSDRSNLVQSLLGATAAGSESSPRLRLNSNQNLGQVQNRPLLTIGVAR
jgi:hypothetical protein